MHTTEHIVNQTMIRLFGCGRAVSAHIERKKSKLDFKLPQPPTEAEIQQIEDCVNRVIQEHLPVTTQYITQDEARHRFDLARLPQNASETVRVVKVGDYDQCLCIGKHVENTSEIGTFKIISTTTTTVSFGCDSNCYNLLARLGGIGLKKLLELEQEGF